MSKKFHMASYDDVDQVIRTRRQRNEIFRQGLKRVRAELRRRPYDERLHPQILGGISIS